MNIGYVVSVILFAIGGIMIGTIAVPLNFIGSYIIDGYNITFTDRCGISKENMEQHNITNCDGWSETGKLGIYNEIYLVTNTGILPQYVMCTHEKLHFEITNMTFDEEEKYIRQLTPIIPPRYDKTCFNLMKKALNLQLIS